MKAFSPRLSFRYPLSCTLWLVLISITSSPSVLAQPISKPIICGNELFHDILERHYPALLDNINTTFKQVSQQGRDLRNEPLTVDIVVHLVWKDAAENLNDSIIQNQIQVLNNDFNKLNADTNNLRSLFQPVAGNANIHFNLASVVRIHTNQLFSVDILGTNLLTEVKHNADGGSDAWDTDKYINIWVCKIQPITIFGIEVGQVFGFSFPPNNLPNWPVDSGSPAADEDGLVIDYRVFGANNPNTIVIPGTTDILAVKGRTPVHEMGHYFGLRHIWGDGGLLGPNDCAQSDGIEDTPFANAQSNFDCDKSRNTCNQSESFYNADVPDLIENYMDYAAEDCMNMFTIGQVNLMRNVLFGPRVALITEPSAVHTLSDQSDISVFPNPASDQLTASFNLSISSKVDIRLLDLNGRIVLEKHENLNPGPIQAGILVNDLPAGIYILQVQGLDGRKNVKVIIERN